MFVEIPNKKYRVMETILTEQILFTMVKEWRSIFPDQIDSIPSRINSIVNSKNFAEKTPDMPITSLTFEDYLRVAKLFSEVYTCWCNRKMLVRPMTLIEYIYCNWHDFDDPLKYDLVDIDDEIRANLSESSMRVKLASHVNIDSLPVPYEDLKEYSFHNQHCIGSSLRVKQKKPNWAGLYDMFFYKWCLVFCNRHEVKPYIAGKMSSYKCIAIGGAYYFSKRPEEQVEKIKLRNFTQLSTDGSWESVGMRYLIEEIEDGE